MSWLRGDLRPGASKPREIMFLRSLWIERVNLVEQSDPGLKRLFCQDAIFPNALALYLLHNTAFASYLHAIFPATASSPVALLLALMVPQ